MIVYMITFGPLLREPESRPYFVILGLVLFIGGMILLIMSILEKSKSSPTESEVNYRILVETSNDLIANIDRKGNFLFMNNAYVKTNEEDNEIGSSRIRTLQLEFVHKNGSIINMESTNTFIRDSNGEVIGILGVARNISDLKKTMAELKSTNEVLEGYVYKISHDFKTPLTFLSNFLSLYLRKKIPELDSESEHYFERINSNIEIMKNLIENVFENYTHVENRKPDDKDSVIEIEMR